MSDVTLVCVTCGKEKIYCTFKDAQKKGWTLGNAEYCPKCKPEKPPMPRRTREWYQFYYYLSMLRGNTLDNLDLDEIRKNDEVFMAWWSGVQRPETWVEDTMVHWHLYPKDFSWEKYKENADTKIKYKTALELRAKNYWYMVFTFQDHSIDYWCGPTLEIY
jgi:hypothetical protein